MIRRAAREIVTAKASGQLYALPEGYPAFLLGSGTVVGDLVTVHESRARKLLQQLDLYEGCFGTGNPSNLYTREVISVGTVGTMGHVDAQVYIYADAARARRLGSRIVDGDWLATRTAAARA
jgi:gamma-glutamylcyclotransferase (GGCT)/AIG2-like uncharacterized protein YtfP